MAQELYQRSLPIKGTIAEKYLLVHRHLEHYNHADLRYCPSIYTRTANGEKYVPALLAFSKDEDGKLHHVQVTKLEQNTALKDTLCEPIKQTFGLISNHFVTLNHQSKGDTAFFTEGVETGLSILEIHQNAPVYATLGKANFLHINPNKLPNKVVLCVDNDGNKTYQFNKNKSTNIIIKSAQRLIDLNINVSIMIPKKENYDLNDVLIKEGKEALKKQLSKTMTLDEYKHQCELKNDKRPPKIKDIQPINNTKVQQEKKQDKLKADALAKADNRLIYRINERMKRVNLEELNRINTTINPLKNREMEREI